jgi:hypothetical protein
MLFMVDNEIKMPASSVLPKNIHAWAILKASSGCNIIVFVRYIAASVSLLKLSLLSFCGTFLFEMSTDAAIVILTAFQTINCFYPKESTIRLKA